MIDISLVSPISTVPSLSDSLHSRGLLIAREIGALVGDLQPNLSWTFDGGEWCGSVVAGQREGLVRIECVGEFCGCGDENRWIISKFGSRAGIRWFHLSSKEVDIDPGREVSEVVAQAIGELLNAS